MQPYSPSCVFLHFSLISIATIPSAVSSSISRGHLGPPVGGVPGITRVPVSSACGLVAAPAVSPGCFALWTSSTLDTAIPPLESSLPDFQAPNPLPSDRAPYARVFRYGSASTISRLCPALLVCHCGNRWRRN